MSSESLPTAAQQMLRHLDLTTTIRHYIKTKRAALMEGVQKLDERLALGGQIAPAKESV